MSKRIEKRGNELARICDECERPSLTATAEGILIQPKHGSDKHKQLVTWAELEEMRAGYGLTVPFALAASASS